MVTIVASATTGHDLGRGNGFHDGADYELKIKEGHLLVSVGQAYQASRIQSLVDGPKAKSGHHWGKGVIFPE